MPGIQHVALVCRRGTVAVASIAPQTQAFYARQGAEASPPCPDSLRMRQQNEIVLWQRIVAVAQVVQQ